MQYKILTSREKKRILQRIQEQWGCKTDAIEDFVFLLTGKLDLYLATREIFDIDVKKLHLNSIGLYFADTRDDAPRLSIEGSQLIGPFAKKNIIELEQKEAILWLKGMDLENKEGDLSEYIIVRCGDDFMGCGKYKPEEKRVLNFIPKSRRLAIAALTEED
jgi:NOL1/NOP2/fmu family ribosome biogenesis protein